MQYIDSELTQGHAREIAYFDKLHREKYRDKGQTYGEHAAQMALRMSTDANHQFHLNDIFSNKRFVPAGRVQAAMGAKDREVSAFNCSVSMTIEDDINSIMQAVSNAAKILRLGTGIGYNFSHIRPKGDLVKKLQSEASGPISFMKIFEAMAATISSSGHRRGAQMGILNINHPDIEEFVDAKMQKDVFRHFNFSVGVTDLFMNCLRDGKSFPLSFNGEIRKMIDPKYLWDKIIHNAYDSAEPGIIFIDRINQDNNLWYCEKIEATNPCAEQPLPANGLCLLGSFNLTKYIRIKDKDKPVFDFISFIKDIPPVVEAYDNIFDKSTYAIPEHSFEAKNKRRMGLGLMGIANAVEYVTGSTYGSKEFNDLFGRIAKVLKNTAYNASTELARTRGAFSAFVRDKYLDGEFIKTLDTDVQANIRKYGIRNSHLISYAPCGTIAQTVGNISSGVEPIFYHSVTRDVHMQDGKQSITLMDYNVRHYNHYGQTLDQCTIEDHISVASIAQKHCDSSVSKTVNVPETCTYDDYQKIYLDAYKAGSKGITVFRPTELRGSVITQAPAELKVNFTELTGEVKIKYGTSGACANGACEI